MTLIMPVEGVLVEEKAEATAMIFEEENSSVGSRKGLKTGFQAEDV